MHDQRVVVVIGQKAEQIESSGAEMKDSTNTKPALPANAYRHTPRGC